MTQISKNWLWIIVLALGVSFQACGKKKTASSVDDADSSMTTETSFSEESLDNFDNYTPEQAQAVLNRLPVIYFGFDQDSLTETSRNDLKKVAGALRTLKTTELSIQGHCDERGSNEYNLALGDRRARSVRDYLVNLGVARNLLDTVSYGEERPADLGSNESAWAKNRRAELVKK